MVMPEVAGVAKRAAECGGKFTITNDMKASRMQISFILSHELRLQPGEEQKQHTKGDSGNQGFRRTSCSE